MATLDLLPPNASQFERDLAGSSDFLEPVEPKVPRIRTAKRIDIPDDVVPWLIYEYGLGELLPYLPDPRVAIAEGVLWQRYRGTPAAIKTALGWINFQATLEESEAGTLRWAQWQLGLDQAPESLAFIGNVIGISRLSSPARSDLFRVYGGWYDFRRFWLDDHKLSSGSWLSDHTGVYLQNDWPQLSFGREFKRNPVAFSTGVLKTKEHIEGELYVYEDRFVLSQSEIDEFWHLLQESTFTVSRLHFLLFQTNWPTTTIMPELQFARAGVYLSDYAELGDTNCCLPCREDFEFGDGAFLLSEGNATTGESVLSQHIQRFEYEEINERFERQTASVVAPYSGFIGIAAKQLDRLTKKFIRYEDHFWLDYGRLDEDGPYLLETSITIHSTTLSPHYQLPLTSWTGGTWLDGGTWNGTFGSMEPALTFAVAGVYLSENYILGDTDTAFSVRELVESGQEVFELDEPEVTTGQSILSEHSVSLDWVEITDRNERQTASVVAPYAGPLGQLDRAIRRSHKTYAIVEDAFVLSGSLLDEEWHLFLYSTYEIFQTSLFVQPEATVYDSGDRQVCVVHAYSGETPYSSGRREVGSALLYSGDSALRSGARDTTFILIHTPETVLRSGSREVGLAFAYAGETILERQHGRLHQTRVVAQTYRWGDWSNYGLATDTTWGTDLSGQSWQAGDWTGGAWLKDGLVWNESAFTVSSQHSSHT